MNELKKEIQKLLINDEGFLHKWIHFPKLRDKNNCKELVQQIIINTPFVLSQRLDERIFLHPK